MQSSRALRALPVVLGLVAPLPLAAQTRYRVTTDGAWFCQEPGGKRLARLARGAVLMGGEVQGDWQGVMLEGWIFATSVGPTPRAGYDLTVTRAPEENLRSAPAGALIGKLPQGFLLNKVVEGTSGRWIHVTRAGGPGRVGEERGLGDRPAGRAGGHHRRRAAHRPTALYGTGAALDSAVHLDTTGRRAAARDPERRDVHAGARATPRARVRVRRGPRGEASAARDHHATRHHPGHRARAHRPHPVPPQPGARHDQPRDPAMNAILRDRLLRKADAVPDDKAYQVLDYVEFLESKYAERPAGAPPFQRVAETLEDTLRAGRVPVNIIRGTMDAVGKAGKLLEKVAAAGKAAVEEAAKKPAEKVEEPPPPRELSPWEPSAPARLPPSTTCCSFRGTRACIPGTWTCAPASPAAFLSISRSSRPRWTPSPRPKWPSRSRGRAGSAWSTRTCRWTGRRRKWIA